MAVYETSIPRQNPSTADQRIDVRQVNQAAHVDEAEDVLQERVILTGAQVEDPPVDVHTHRDGQAADLGENSLHVILTPKAENLVAGNVTATTAGTVVVRPINLRRKSLHIYSDSLTTDVYISGEDTTTVDNSFKLPPGSGWTDTSYTGQIRCRSASGTVVVYFMEIDTE